MLRTLTVKGNLGTFDESTFLLAENESLRIRVNFADSVRVNRFRVVVRHGLAQEQVFTLRNGQTIDLSAQWLNDGGTEDVEFSLLYLNANETAVIKEDFVIEPLRVEKINGVFALAPFLRQILAVQEDMLARISNLEEKLQAYEDNGVEWKAEE